MKEAFYFSHDYTARNDQKILTLRGDFGLEGYALYFMMLESMAEESDGYIHRVAIGGLGVSYGVTKEKLLAFIEKCIEIGLFIEDKYGIFSKRMIEHKGYRKSLSEQGKLGAEKRWKNSPPISTPNAKERKGKETKEKKSKTETDISKDIGSTDLVNKSDPDINNITEVIKGQVEFLGLIYKKGSRERERAKNILTGKDFGQVCEKANMSRIEFCKSIIYMSSKLDFWNGKIYNSETLYKHYAQVYNEAVNLKAKKQKDTSLITF